MFSRFGIIKNIKIVVEPSTNQSRGMAFVEMATVEQATKAIEALNQKVFDGRTVKANWAIPQRNAPPTKEAKKKIEKDLEFKSVQIAKKAKNEAKRKSNPLAFKLPSKKAK